MDNKELVLIVAKEILLKAMDNVAALKPDLRGGEPFIADIGERYKTLVQKVDEAFKQIK
jgi:hypothetical protein